MISWLLDHWFHVIFPLSVFIAVVVLGLWARSAIYKVLKKQQRTTWVHGSVIKTIWHPFLLWFILLGVYAAIEISILSQTGKRLAVEGLASLFVLSLIWIATSLSGRLISFYIGKTKATRSLTSVVFNIARIIIFTIGILIIFDIWGAPTLPIIIALFASLFIVVFAFRNTIDNLLAGLEITFGEHIKVGHLIELESGEAGYVTQISWTRTTMQTSEGNLVIIPNYKLMANIIINCGTSANRTEVTNVQTTATAINRARPLDILSGRELEVLSLIGKGSTNREIAQKLFVSEHTVKSHIRSILSKLNIRNRQQAAAYAEREGLNLGITR